MLTKRLDDNTLRPSHESIKGAGISPTTLRLTSLEAMQPNSKSPSRSVIVVSNSLTSDESTSENGVTSDTGDETADDHAGDDESSELGYSGEEEGSESYSGSFSEFSNPQAINTRAVQKSELDDTESTSSPLRNSPHQFGFNEIKEDEESSEFLKILDASKESESETKRVQTENGFQRLSGQAARSPYYHASALGTWYSVVAYDACVRLCLNAWARGCAEAPEFLENECALLREAFGVKQALLQSEEELMKNQSTSRVDDKTCNAKPKKHPGKMKVEVRKVKINPSPSTTHYSTKSIFSRVSLNRWKNFHIKESFPRQISRLIRTGVTSLRNSASSYEDFIYLCVVKLKSSTEQDAVKMQTGSADAHIFSPENMSDELIIDVTDSLGKKLGSVSAQVAAFVDNAVEKSRWLPIYNEPDHLLVGKLHLSVTYNTSSEDSTVKCDSVSETVAYDCSLEVAMKMQRFQQRNLVLHGSWQWILSEFASYYGVPDAYTKLRYLSYVMDVATPTSDCLTLVYDLLAPVISKPLSLQENRLLREAKGQIEEIIRMVFENYKSLDESVLSGIDETGKLPTVDPPPALKPSVKLFTLLHDLSSAVAQTSLTCYLQSAVKKSSGRHLSEMDEFVGKTNNANTAAAYQKMASICLNMKDEVRRDICIHNSHVFPSFVNLPNLTCAIYSTDLSAKLGEFLLAYPPSGPSSFVTQLIIATSDIQRDIASWNACHVKGGVDAKELFHLYIMVWIQEQRGSLLESCKKWRADHSTPSFVGDMYDRLAVFVSEYETVIGRWPEYIFVLENAVADVERAIVAALDREYAEVVAPLNHSITKKRYSFKNFCGGKSTVLYSVPEELGILLNTMKRMMGELRPKMESTLKERAPRSITEGHSVPGDRLSEVTVMLRSKMRGYVESISEKLANNTKIHNSTKMKRILLESKNSTVENDVRRRVDPLKNIIIGNMNHLHSVFYSAVFVSISRGYWNILCDHVLQSLGNKNDRRSLHKVSLLVVSILDVTFASQMKELLGNDDHIEPPRSSAQVRSLLCT